MRIVGISAILSVALAVSGCAAAAKPPVASEAAAAEATTPLASQTAAGGAKPLFVSNEMITLRIEAPFADLIREAPNSKTPFPATLILEGGARETHAIMLSPRGKSRRNTEICSFPPLRVAFDEKPGDASLFDGQKRLKLVTHCRRTSTFQQYLLLEYNAYRLLNIMTPASLRVRLAEIEYVDSVKGKTVVTRKGFFIEDTDDTAKRNGVKEIDIDDITVSQLDPMAAARYALFQYMIGNLDWSMHNAIADDDCCHNTKLIGGRTEPLSALTPVPYDFDHSGLVDTPYAAVPVSVPVRSVRTRRYRGFCAHNEAAILAASTLLAKRHEVEAVFDETPGLKSSTARKAKRFLNKFFGDIKDRETIEKRLLKYCRE